MYTLKIMKGPQFISQATEAGQSFVADKYNQEGGAVVPDVVGFALVLDRLTIAMKADWRVLDTCIQAVQQNIRGEGERDPGSAL